MTGSCGRRAASDAEAFIPDSQCDGEAEFAIPRDSGGPQREVSDQSRPRQDEQDFP